MDKKGQIVEIPVSSPIYNRELPDFYSKKDELNWKSLKKEYSLFDGFLVGEHLGSEKFRIGQRKGLNVGGKREPLYVISIDEKENRVFVGAGDLHPGLWISVIGLGSIEGNIDFPNEDLEKGIDVEISTSVNEDKISAKFYGFENDFFLEFENPVPIIIENQPFDIICQNIIINNNTKN